MGKNLLEIGLAVLAIFSGLYVGQQLANRLLASSTTTTTA